jgi:hypothetical protein
VIFTDETKINCFGSNGRTWCWAATSKGLTDRTVLKTVMHGGGSIMVWGSMTAMGPGLISQIQGKMDQHVYCQILETNVSGTLSCKESLP